MSEHLFGSDDDSAPDIPDIPSKKRGRGRKTAKKVTKRASDPRSRVKRSTVVDSDSDIEDDHAMNVATGNVDFEALLDRANVSKRMNSKNSVAMYDVFAALQRHLVAGPKVFNGAWSTFLAHLSQKGIVKSKPRAKRVVDESASMRKYIARLAELTTDDELMKKNRNMIELNDDGEKQPAYISMYKCPTVSVDDPQFEEVLGSCIWNMRTLVDFLNSNGIKFAGIAREGKDVKEDDQLPKGARKIYMGQPIAAQRIHSPSDFCTIRSDVVRVKEGELGKPDDSDADDGAIISIAAPVKPPKVSRKRAPKTKSVSTAPTKPTPAPVSGDDDGNDHEDDDPRSDKEGHGNDHEDDDADKGEASEASVASEASEADAHVDDAHVKRTKKTNKLTKEERLEEKKRLKREEKLRKKREEKRLEKERKKRSMKEEGGRRKKSRSEDVSDSDGDAML